MNNIFCKLGAVGADLNIVEFQLADKQKLSAEKLNKKTTGKVAFDVDKYIMVSR